MWKRAREDSLEVKTDGSGKEKKFNNTGFSEAIKVGQRSSTNFKQAWHSYCERNGHQTFDPSRHSCDFIATFFDQLGVAYCQGGGNYGMQMSGVTQVGFGGMAMGGVHGGGGGVGGVGGKGKGKKSPKIERHDPCFQKVMELVKQGQRNCHDWKQLWINWCAEKANGVQDPNRHTPIFIIAFVLQFGLAEVVSASWAQPYLVSLGELSKPFMVASIKRGQGTSQAFKEAWAQFAEREETSNGSVGPGRDPNRHDAGSLMEFFDTIALHAFPEEHFMKPYVTGVEEIMYGDQVP